ncbi:MAG TPA: hypothetical protein VNQ81_15780 [Povalibacter sp.]|nr:hypothetical protein [Povalibacter sp.]
MVCSAQGPAAPAAARAVLDACIESAASGAAVDTAKLAPHFKAASPGQNKRFESVEPLPDMELLIDHVGILRCTLMADKSAAKSEFATALTKAIRSRPGFERGSLQSVSDAHLAPGDAAKGIHRVMVTMEEDAEKETWTVTVWDGRLPSVKAN